MSEPEQHAALGRAMSDYVKVRKELAALRSVVNEKAKTLGEVSRLMDGDIGSPRWQLAIAEYPSKEELQKLAGNLASATQQRVRLREYLCESGFEPKD